MIAEFIALKIHGLPYVKQRMLLSIVVLESNTEYKLIGYREVCFYLQVSIIKVQGVNIYLTLRNCKLGPVLISQDLSPRNAFANYPGVEPLSCAYKSENLQSLSPPLVSLAP